jgi:predicted nucleic acid-binding protein
VQVSAQDLRKFGERFADLADAEVMDAVAMTDWLIDKSALVRLGDSPDAEEWANRIERGLVRITTVTRLEVGCSARTAAQARAAFESPADLGHASRVPDAHDRGQGARGPAAARRQGQHRGPSIPDLLIAATAELAGLTVLHFDKDFDLIAKLTGQAAERLGV